ncbi:RcnB family protein [Massilia niastensis]|uniref:RcnB family protein n=1 Tax=Massilia niastensis TaxID=544911 RepID=UPI0003711633|nr:RcnB family protein [Massilia niastensis]
MNELIVPVLLAALLAGGPRAQAQQRPQLVDSSRTELRDERVKRSSAPAYRSVEASGTVRRGEQLPPRYRAHQYVIENWRALRLDAPPRGHQWVQAGRSYALVAIATGAVVEVLAGR